MDLKQLRERKSISLEKAARQLDVSTVTLWRWETKSSGLPASILPAIKRLYDLTDQEFVKFVDAQQTKQETA